MLAVCIDNAKCYQLFLYYSSTKISASKLLLRLHKIHTGPGFFKDGLLEPGVNTILATIWLSVLT